MGKQKGFVLYDEVSEVLPGDLEGGGELDDVLANLDVAGIEILEDAKDFEKKLDDSEEPLDLEPMRVVARSFVGQHDFGAFAVERDGEEGSSVVRLERLEIVAHGALILVVVEGSHFLWRQAAH